MHSKPTLANEGSCARPGMVISTAQALPATFSGSWKLQFKWITKRTRADGLVQELLHSGHRQLKHEIS